MADIIAIMLCQHFIQCWILTYVNVNVADGSHLNIIMADVNANVVERMTTL